MIVVIIALAIGIAMVIAFAWFVDVVCRYQDRIDNETEQPWPSSDRS